MQLSHFNTGSNTLVTFKWNRFPSAQVHNLTALLGKISELGIKASISLLLVPTLSPRIVGEILIWAFENVPDARAGPLSRLLLRLPSEYSEFVLSTMLSMRIDIWALLRPMFLFIDLRDCTCSANCLASVSILIIESGLNSPKTIVEILQFGKFLYDNFNFYLQIILLRYWSSYL